MGETHVFHALPEPGPAKNASDAAMRRANDLLRQMTLKEDAMSPGARA